MDVGLIGATGYAGLELVNILDTHPHFSLKLIGSRSHDQVALSSIFQKPLRHEYKLINLEDFEASIHQLQLVFLSLPHAQSMPWVEKIRDKGIPVVDLSGDYRLDDANTYKTWYGLSHLNSTRLKSSVYGLSELNAELIANASLIANPGCYPTATLLALSPLAKNGLLNNKTLIVDAKSGMSGAGKKLSQSVLYCESNETMRPYGTGAHRHTPEIELTLQKIGARHTKILFSPSVVPMDRGILSSIYIQMDGTVDFQTILSLYKSAYKDKSFIRLIDKMPETRWVKNTNYCDIHLVYDQRTSTLIVHSVIDNLIKGAAGQAVQNANLMFKLPETAGLV